MNFLGRLDRRIQGMIFNWGELAGKAFILLIAVAFGFVINDVYRTGQAWQAKTVKLEKMKGDVELILANIGPISTGVNDINKYIKEEELVFKASLKQQTDRLARFEREAQSVRLQVVDVKKRANILASSTVLQEIRAKNLDSRLKDLESKNSQPSSRGKGVRTIGP